jgi:hypothetical protein
LLPLSALFEQLDPLETLQDIALCDDRAGSSETAMLGHNSKNERQS